MHQNWIKFLWLNYNKTNFLVWVYICCEYKFNTYGSRSNATWIKKTQLLSCRYMYMIIISAGGLETGLLLSLGLVLGLGLRLGLPLWLDGEDSDSSENSPTLKLWGFNTRSFLGKMRALFPFQSFKVILSMVLECNISYLSHFLHFHPCPFSWQNSLSLYLLFSKWRFLN